VDLLLRAVNRRLEYEADLIGARIAGKDAMISALKKMSEMSSERMSKFQEILSDHPSIENRIRRLQEMGDLIYEM